MPLDNFLEHVTHLRTGTLNDSLGALDIRRETALDELAHDKRLEELERHLFGQATLMKLQLRPDDDDRTTGVVNALAEEVLTEAPLLAPEHVGKALELVIG